MHNTDVDWQMSTWLCYGSHSQGGIFHHAFFLVSLRDIFEIPRTAIIKALPLPYLSSEQNTPASSSRDPRCRHIHTRVSRSTVDRSWCWKDQPRNLFYHIELNRITENGLNSTTLRGSSTRGILSLETYLDRWWAQKSRVRRKSGQRFKSDCGPRQCRLLVANSAGGKHPILNRHNWHFFVFTLPENVK